MKIPVKILFRIIFLIAVLFCFEMDVYSNCNNLTNSIEISTCGNVVENSFNSEWDSCDDDQINFFNKPGLLIEPGSQQSALTNCFVLLNSSVSVWHPPKIS